MLTPEYLQGLPSELEKLYLKLEEDMISDICRRIKLAGQLTDTAEYQVLRMKELGAGTEYIKRKIAEYSQLSDDAVERMFFDAAQVSDDFYREAYSKANKDYVPFEYNDFFQQIVTANINQTNGELRNFTRSMGFSYRGSNGVRRFHDTAETYRDCLDYAFTQVETGAVDYITAVRNAARRLTESGLQFVDYSSGVVNHADAAVRRAVLTGISQVTGKIAEHNAAELDTDIVEVTAHAGARPDHAEWQGGWYSLSGKSKKYRSLAEATGYGRVDGLKGANCRHDFYPVIEGVDKPMYTAEELANIDPPPFTDKNGKTYTYYEATQRQRAMERAIRKTKREILAADNSGDSDMFTAKSVLLRRQREEYNRFSNAAGLLTQNERNQVVGFGRSVASRAAWADRRATASSSSGGSGNSNGLGGHAVEIGVSGSDNGGNGKLYRDTGLTSDGENDIIKIQEKTRSTNRFATSQKHIDDLIRDDLYNINFTVDPVYNPRIRDNGRTIITENAVTGEVIRVEKVEIGKQDKDSAEFLLDTIIHEELEARIAIRTEHSKKYTRLYYECSDDERHEYINKLIDRFFKMKGWWHDTN